MGKILLYSLIIQIQDNPSPLPNLKKQKKQVLTPKQLNREKTPKINFYSYQPFYIHLSDATIAVLIYKFY